MIPRPPRSPLFPYTTLFRSLYRRRHAAAVRPTDTPVPGPGGACPPPRAWPRYRDRKSTRLNSSHTVISYAVFCLKKKKRDRGFRFLFLGLDRHSLLFILADC